MYSAILDDILPWKEIRRDKDAEKEPPCTSRSQSRLTLSRRNAKLRISARKLRHVSPQSHPRAPPDALSDNEDQTYGETSDGTDEEDDDELEATIENSEARFVARQLTSY